MVRGPKKLKKYAKDKVFQVRKTWPYRGISDIYMS